MTNIETHEFYLKDLNSDGKPIYRVALGNLINAKERKTFPPIFRDQEVNDKSGSIGFMDVTIDKHPLPLETDSDMYELTKALTILTIGIEPDYRGNGYAKMLQERAEELAIDWGLDVVLIEIITSGKIWKLTEKMGYHIVYDDCMFKRLHPCKA